MIVDNLVVCKNCGGTKWFLEKIVVEVKGKNVRKLKSVCCTCESKKEMVKNGL